MIVVANRCTDKTAAIAGLYGARVLINDDKCISAVRNTGVKAANGEIVVTIDADSMMTKYSLVEIKSMLQSGRYVGGGASAPLLPPLEESFGYCLLLIEN